VAELKEIHHVVSDQELSPEYQRMLEAHHLHCTLA